MFKYKTWKNLIYQKFLGCVKNDINTKKKENSTGKTMPIIWWSIPRYDKTETQERCSNQFWCRQFLKKMLRNDFSVEAARSFVLIFGTTRYSINLYNRCIHIEARLRFIQTKENPTIAKLQYCLFHRFVEAPDVKLYDGNNNWRRYDSLKKLRIASGSSVVPRTGWIASISESVRVYRYI